jgi:hypothetical protein
VDEELWNAVQAWLTTNCTAPTQIAGRDRRLELLHRRCCGLDVHKETAMACLRVVSSGKVTTEVRTFRTTTADLLRLSERLAANGCTLVAMEATGVFWEPVWHILDDGEFELVLANAAHVKNVPGRKTDINDAMWLAELLAHGLTTAIPSIAEDPAKPRRGAQAAPSVMPIIAGLCPNNDALRDLTPPPPILAMFLDGETIAIEIRNVGG